MAKRHTSIIGGNACRNRSHNRRVVLDFVRANEPAGRAEIARSCGLSVQAVSNIIESLEHDGLLQADGHRLGARGKPALQYRFDPDRAFSVGVELRPDVAMCALINLSGEMIFWEQSELADASLSCAIEAVSNLVNRAISASGRDQKSWLGTGIVMPGPFGVSEISFAGGTSLPGWDNVDIRRVFSEALGCEVIVENDATAAAISERMSGVARGLDSFCFVYFGTGLGLGVISGGHAQGGAMGNAGEIGHVITASGGLSCACGNRGCLEMYASRASALRYLSDSGVAAANGNDLSALLRENSPVLSSWLDRAAEHLSRAIGMVENLLDPEAVILGGVMPEPIVAALVARLDLPRGSVSNRKDRTIARVLQGSSGRHTAAMGGAAMIVHQTITPSITVYS
ncbi:MAG TPA: ROK family transcriptional regulator [Devosia sp.]|nr:ROK family transcriptional regulator [Devosia sp.]